MEAKERRVKIECLLQGGEPITGSMLAKSLGVSRQVIVTDIAILRAAGANIFATPNGYVNPAARSCQMIVSKIACSHEGIDRLEEELRIIIDNGAKVLDVIVEHPIYGEIKGTLMLASRRELAAFMEKLRRSGAKPLSVITEGIHLHTIEAPSQEVLDRIVADLRNAGILVK